MVAGYIPYIMREFEASRPSFPAVAVVVFTLKLLTERNECRDLACRLLSVT